MKFSCGLTKDSKMDREQQRAVAEAARLRLWHKKFLWWPTTTNEEGGKRICRWLTFVERRYPLAEADLEYDTFRGRVWGVYYKYTVEYREITK